MGGRSESIVLPVGEAGEAVPPQVAPRRGEQEPSIEEYVVERILFLEGRCVDAPPARITGEGNIPRPLDHGRDQVNSGMRGVAREGGLIVPAGREERKRPDDQECCEFHIPRHSFSRRHRLFHPALYCSVKMVPPEVEPISLPFAREWDGVPGDARIGKVAMRPAPDRNGRII